MPSYTTVIDALSANDLVAARDLLLAEIMEQTKDVNSWDSPHYSVDKSIQQGLKLDYSRNNNFTYFGLENLRDRYVLKGEDGKILENPQTFFARVARDGLLLLLRPS